MLFNGAVNHKITSGHCGVLVSRCPDHTLAIMETNGFCDNLQTLGSFTCDISKYFLL